MIKWKTAARVISALLLLLLAIDYAAYRAGKTWYAAIQRDLPIGTTINTARVYLQDEAHQHGIIGLYEDTRPSMRGFLFERQNPSYIFSLIIDGIDDSLQSQIAIRFDEDGRLKSISTFK